MKRYNSILEFCSIRKRANREADLKFVFSGLFAQSGLSSFDGDKFQVLFDLVFNLYCFYLDVGGFVNIKFNKLLLASFRFLRNYYTTKEIMNFIKQLFSCEDLVDFVDTDDLMGFEPSEDDLEAQGFLKGSRQLLDSWKDISECELSKKFNYVVKALLTCSLTKQCSLDFLPSSILEYSTSAKYLDSTVKTSPLQMVQSVFDFIVSFCESGYEFFYTGEIRAFLTADRACRDFVKDWEKLEVELTGSVKNLQARPTLYLDRLDKIIARGNALLSKENFMLRPLVKSAMDHRMKFLKQVNISCFRKPPFSVLLYGPPGIGKSSIVQTIGTLYHKVTTTMSIDGQLGGEPIYPGLPWDPMMNTYTKNPYDDFWSGYRGAAQWCVILDDLAREKARQIENGLGLTIVELLSIVNSIGVTSNQAALEDKGCVPIIPKLVVATSNTKDLNAFHAGSCPEAILRRLPYVIRPIVKPEYWDEERGRMKEMTERVEDAWTFEVETYCMYLDNGHTKGRYIKHKPDPTSDRNCTMAELNSFLCEKILSHERASESMMQGLEIDSSITICVHGVLSNFECLKCAAEEHLSVPSSFECELNKVSIPEDDDCDTDCDPHEELEGQGLKSLVFGAAKLAKRPAKTILNAVVFRPACSLVETLAPYLGNTSYFSPISQFIATSTVDWGNRELELFLQAGELLPAGIFDKLLLFLIKKPQARAAFYYLLHQHYSLRIPRNVYIASVLLLQGVQFYGAYRLTSYIINKVMPQPSLAEAQANIWRSMETNDDFAIPKTTTKNNVGELERTVSRAMFELSVRNAGSKGAQRVFCFQLVSNWLCTVGHVFPLDSGPWQCVASFGVATGNMRPMQGFTISEEDLKRLPNDVVLFTSKNLLPRRCLFKYLPKKIDKAGRHFRVTNGSSGSFGSGMTTRYGTISYTVQDEDGTSKTIVGTYMDGIREDRSPVKGDCGSIVISDSAHGSFISGMHVAGSKSDANYRAIITQLSQDMFEDIIYQRETYLQAPTESRYSSGSRGSGPLDSPHPGKGVHHWALNPKGVVLGSYKGRIQPTTHVKRSLICSEIEEAFGYENPFHKPVMKAVEENGKWKNPFTIATEQQGSLPCDFLQKDVDACALSYLNDVTQDSSWLRDVKPLTLRQAVNGIHGADFIDILNMSTSGGFYFPGHKSDYFDKLVDSEGIEFYMPNEEVTEMIDHIESTYMMGDRYNVLFNATLKDEPVSLKKKNSGATRVFTACDVAFSIVVRRQYLSVAAAMQRNNFITECAVGMNLYSLEWDQLFKHITSFGEDKIVAGDFETFDKRMPAIIISTAFGVLDSLRSYGYKPSAAAQMISRGICTDISFPVTNMNGELIQFFGGNSSGHPLTIIINSIANSIYMRFAYMKTGHDLSGFRNNVHLMVMGDDNILCSNISSYNHTSISRALKTVGINYTMADKDADSRPFCNIRDVDFCKRSFVDLDGRCIAPLAEKSIFKSLCMYVEKGNIEHEQQLAQSYLAARREWSLHGPDIFNHHTSILDSIFEKHPDIKRFFIDKHFWDYQATLDWTLGVSDAGDF